VDHVTFENGIKSYLLCILSGIVLFIFFLMLLSDSSSGEEGGGSDENVTVEANAGGGGEFQWNDTRAFVIKEHDYKIDDEFNIVICEEIKYNTTKKKHEPVGHIFGELYGIQWDDDPPPMIRITGEDFQKYQHDESNISVYIYGDYYNEAQEKVRYAYIQLIITRPNHAPTPVAQVSGSDEWNWSTVNETNSARFIVEDTEPLVLWFNGSSSWDVDLDNITNWKWDLDGDGKFGYTHKERGINKSASFSHDTAYELGLIVIDERGKISGILNFTIEIILKAETGGTDQDIKLSGIAGQSTGYEWNELHDFVIRENGKRSDDRFNVTLCKDLEWDDGDWIVSGHIFAKLKNIHWQDDPNPMIRISDQDFVEFGEDPFNITLYAHASYYHSTEGYRYAYKRFDLQRPNLPPTAVAHLTFKVNESAINLTHMNRYSFYIDLPGNLECTFNAGSSWDQDADQIAVWRWALEDNGEFGAHDDERIEVTSRNFTVGTYHLGLVVGDGKDLSEELRFTLRIIENPLRSDLTFGEVSVVNMEEEKSYFDRGDRIEFNLIVENTGRNLTIEPLEILIEQRESGEQVFEYLAGQSIAPPLLPGDAREIILVWDTSLTTTTTTILGTYEIRITLDSHNTILEYNETDNEHRLFLDIVDRMAPSILLFSGLNNTTVNETIFISGQVTDNVEVLLLEYRLREDLAWESIEPGESWSLELNTTTIPDGSYSIEFRAWDGIQYSESTYLNIRIQNKDNGPDTEVPVYLIAFLISLALVCVAIVAFTRDKSGLSKKRTW